MTVEICKIRSCLAYASRVYHILVAWSFSPPFFEILNIDISCSRFAPHFSKLLPIFSPEILKVVSCYSICFEHLFPNCGLLPCAIPWERVLIQNRICSIWKNIPVEVPRWHGVATCHVSKVFDEIYQKQWNNMSKSRTTSKIRSFVKEDY